MPSPASGRCSRCSIYATIFYGSFVKLWGVDYSLTFDHYVKAFAIGWNEFGIHWRGAAWSSFWTTMEIALISAPLTAAIGLLTAYLLVRQSFAGKDAFEFGTMLSFAIPGTVIGVSYIIAFNVPPIELTGTGMILVLSFIFRNMPVGVRAGVASMSQIDRSLDESSLTLGANSWQTFRKVVLPLLRPAILAALVYSFVRAMTAISAIIFLVSAQYDMSTSYIVGRVENNEYGIAIAYSAVLIVVMLAVIGADAARRRQPQHRPPRQRRRSRAVAHQCQPAAGRRSLQFPEADDGRDQEQRRFGGVPERHQDLRQEQTPAVNDISLFIEAGKLVTLLGPSGCGKTTTLRMIAGLEMATAGQILIGGEDVTRLPATDRDVSHGVPVLRAVPAHDGARERRIRPALLRLRQEGGRATAPAPGWSWSASPASATGCPASSPAASSSASPSPARWCSSRRCCSSTSRSPISTPSCAAACARRSAKSSRSSA